MKYEAINRYCSRHSVRKMCKVLGLKEAAYYQWLRRTMKREEKRRRDAELAKQVRCVFDENRQVYGYRKMWEALLQKGLELSAYRVRKIMRENGMYSAVVKKFKPSKGGKADGRYLDNLLNQNFSVSGPNMVWAGDITYIKTKLGFLYLAVVIDLFNKEVIGYSIGRQIDAELVKAALTNAIARSGLKGGKTIFHSDRGSQYASKTFQKALCAACITGSMSKPSCPYDNACVESFFSCAKRECIYRKAYATLADVKADMFSYIELFYNRKRIHSSLGYMSPVDYRMKHAA